MHEAVLSHNVDGKGQRPHQLVGLIQLVGGNMPHLYTIPMVIICRGRCHYRSIGIDKFSHPGTYTGKIYLRSCLQICRYTGETDPNHDSKSAGREYRSTEEVDWQKQDDSWVSIYMKITTTTKWGRTSPESEETSIGEKLGEEGKKPFTIAQGPLAARSSSQQ